MLIIESARNGFLVTIPKDEPDGTEEIIVFEENDDPDGDLITMQNLLWFICEHLGINYSKHNKQNIEISIQNTV